MRHCNINNTGSLIHSRCSKIYASCNLRRNLAKTILRCKVIAYRISHGTFFIFKQFCYRRDYFPSLYLPQFPISYREVNKSINNVYVCILWHTFFSFLSIYLYTSTPKRYSRFRNILFSYHILHTKHYLLLFVLIL